MSAEVEPERDDVGEEPVVRALADAVAGRPSVSLEQVLSVAALTTRFELKYLVPLADLPAVLDRLPPQLAVLDVGQRRIFAYQSVYFDTEDFALYRQHVQGRRRRYKARTRSYCDTSESMFEVKLKGGRGQTVKERLPHDFRRRAELTGPARAFLDAVIEQAYGCAVPGLQPVLTTAYRRATLVDLASPSRVTIDVDLSWSDRAGSHWADQLALIETKSSSGPGPVDALMGSLGLRPVRLSKYCLGVALLHPDTAANPWHQLLTRHFGWQRTADPISVPATHGQRDLMLSPQRRG